MGAHGEEASARRRRGADDGREEHSQDLNYDEKSGQLWQLLQETSMETEISMRDTDALKHTLGLALIEHQSLTEYFAAFIEAFNRYKDNAGLADAPAVRKTDDCAEVDFAGRTVRMLFRTHRPMGEGSGMVGKIICYKIEKPVDKEDFVHLGTYQFGTDGLLTSPLSLKYPMVYDDGFALHAVMLMLDRALQCEPK